jgi:hypothetical protein
MGSSLGDARRQGKVEEVSDRKRVIEERWYGSTSAEVKMTSG